MRENGWSPWNISAEHPNLTAKVAAAPTVVFPAAASPSHLREETPTSADFTPSQYPCRSSRDDAFAIDMGLPSPPPPVNITRLSPAAFDASLPSPSSAPAQFPPMTEKERFRAAMENGITKTPTKAHRSMTAPLPQTGANSGTPMGGSRPEGDEATEALRKQQQFKEDLQRQIQENKRLKQLEAER